MPYLINVFMANIMANICRIKILLNITSYWKQIMEIVDIVIPKGNELSLINRAKKLGYSGICLVYHEKEISDSRINELRTKYPSSKEFKLSFGVVVKSNPTKFRKYGTLFCRSNNVSLIKQNINILFDIEETSDSMHQRKSGLNYSICNLMHEKGVSYGISISSILNCSQMNQLNKDRNGGNERANLLGRIIQNVMLCNKYNVKITCGSFASSHLELKSPSDIESFLRIIGVKDTKGALKSLMST